MLSLLPLLTLVSIPAVAAPPAAVQATDAARYAPAVAALRDGPVGCWEVVGTASWSWSTRLGRTSSSGDANFVGKIEDGVWKDFIVRSLGEDLKVPRATQVRVFGHHRPAFAPIMGTLGDGVRDQLDDETLERVSSMLLPASSATPADLWSEWSDEQQAVILHSRIPLDGSSQDAQARVQFDDGAAIPTRIDVEYPSSFGLGDGSRVQIHNAQASLRGTRIGDVILPAGESTTYTIRRRGGHVETAQSIAYETFRPCGGSAIAELTPLLP